MTNRSRVKRGDSTLLASRFARAYSRSTLRSRLTTPVRALVQQHRNAKASRIAPARLADLPAIRDAYENGRAMQRAQQSVVWPEFSDAAIVREIETDSLFCVLDGATMAGVFSMIDEDSLLWGDAERGAHLYLHRIARASTYRGRGLVDAILAWAHQQCSARGLEGLRMDTWASNDALIAYYSARGFRLVGTRRLDADRRLATHYHGIELALLEAPVSHTTSGT